jgi:hypothetical protein
LRFRTVLPYPQEIFLAPFILIPSRNVLWCNPTRQSSLRFLASFMQADGNVMNRAAELVQSEARRGR